MIRRSSSEQWQSLFRFWELSWDFIHIPKAKKMRSTSPNSHKSDKEDIIENSLKNPKSKVNHLITSEGSVALIREYMPPWPFLGTRDVWGLFEVQICYTCWVHIVRYCWLYLRQPHGRQWGPQQNETTCCPTQHWRGPPKWSARVGNTEHLVPRSNQRRSLNCLCLIWEQGVGRCTSFTE